MKKTKTQSSSPQNAHPPATSGSARPWSGGVVRISGMRHRGKPLRVAAWLGESFSLRGAVIVDDDGPAALFGLLMALLEKTPEKDRPSKIEVDPKASKAFRGLVFPEVEIKEEPMLKVVLEDQADFGRIHDLPVWRG